MSERLLSLFGKDGRYWTKEAYARDANGDYCSVRSNEAVSFCLVGGILKLRDIGHIRDTNEMWRVMGEFPKAVVMKTGKPPTIFNDDPTTTWEDIKLLLHQLKQPGL